MNKKAVLRFCFFLICNKFILIACIMCLLFLTYMRELLLRREVEIHILTSAKFKALAFYGTKTNRYQEESPLKIFPPPKKTPPILNYILYPKGLDYYNALYDETFKKEALHLYKVNHRESNVEIENR